MRPRRERARRIRNRFCRVYNNRLRMFYCPRRASYCLIAPYRTRYYINAFTSLEQMYVSRTPSVLMAAIFINMKRKHDIR